MADDTKERFWKRLNIAIMVIGLAMAIYHLVSSQWLFQNNLEFRNNHLGFALVLVFLSSLKAKRKRVWLGLTLATLSVVVAGYVQANFGRLEESMGFPTGPDMVIDALLIILALEATREKFGLLIPVLASAFAGYTFLVPYLPPPFYHPIGDPGRILAMFTTSFSGSGMYGTALGASANYIFLFLLFGGLLQLSGATDFFVEVAKVVGRKLRGGPAQMAVISSAMCATVTGSAMANVMITGSFTIPAMKKIGYHPQVAGAVEAVASTGGLITPPVMGASAFLMASFTGIPYSQIMVVALLPAVFYYWSCFTYVELYARKINILPASERVDWRLFASRAPLFLIPVGVIIGLLLMEFSPTHAGAWAVISLVVLFLGINAFTRERTWRQQFKLLLEGTVEGAKSGASIAVVTAVLGLMMGMMTMTGVGLQVTRIVADWSQGVLLVGALITMVVCVFLGTLVVAPIVYGLAVVLAAPALLQMGTSVLQVHFFLLWYASLSAITPPVAVAALAASAISGASYMKTAIASWLISLGVFTFPFIILWNQTLLFNPPDPLTGGLTIIAIALSIVALNSGVTGYSFVSIKWPRRMLFILCSAGLLFYTVSLDHLLFSVLVILLGTLTFLGWRDSRVKVAGAEPARLAGT